MLSPGSLPFTREQFINVFADYNNAIWPMQVFAYLLGVIMIVALARPAGLVSLLRFRRGAVRASAP